MHHEMRKRSSMVSTSIAAVYAIRSVQSSRCFLFTTGKIFARDAKRLTSCKKFLNQVIAPAQLTYLKVKANT